ncbi:hypothetical protein [Paenibacillus alvei]|uniref:hypothetical protein n=1 Tax=Paenibacillus alvei TaxID=44250 RepID=UPI0015809C46|nr:hypothetical protein [Paenibacillus alvei]
MNGNNDNQQSFYTAEEIGRSLGTTPEQVKRFAQRGLITFIPADFRTYSKYGFRVWETDLLDFFNCKTFDDFRKLKYRGC